MIKLYILCCICYSMRNVAVLDFAEKLGDKRVYSVKQDVIYELSTSPTTDL